MKTLAKAGVVVDCVSRILFVVASLGLMLIVISVIFEVVMRYFLDSPTKWVVLVSSLTLAIVTFLSIAWIEREGGHVRMDLLVNRLDIRSQALLGAVTSMLATLALLTVAWYGGKTTWELFLIREMWGDQPFDLLRAPFYAVVPIGSFMVALQMIRRTFIYIQSWILRKETAEVETLTTAE